MPSHMKKRRPMEAEPGEGKAHEMRESPEEEVREGSESEEGHYGKTNRKRSAKGAKKTKAPMDAEGCGCGGKKGATCDGNCGSSMKKRSDALTPQEYLTACDLGIQGRSRSYIRARLDAAERLDKKCGASGIAENKKCNVGTGKSAAKGSSLGTALKVIGTGAALAGAGYVGMKLGQAAVENHKRKAHNRAVRSKQRGEGARRAVRAAVGFGATVATGNKQYLNRANKDSVFAHGFDHSLSGSGF